MINSEHKAPEIEGWVCVHKTSMEHDAEMVKNYFSDMEIPCEILNKKDRSYTVNFGSLAQIFVYVPEEQKVEAEKALKEWQNAEIQGGPDEDDTESPDED